MRAASWLGFLGGGLVFSASLLGGASLNGSGLRALGALVLFGLMGRLFTSLWRVVGENATALTAPGAAATPSAPAAASNDGQQPGRRLDQVLPAASPADLFEPLNPPVLTTQGMEE